MRKLLVILFSLYLTSAFSQSSRIALEDYLAKVSQQQTITFSYSTPLIQGLFVQTDCYEHFSKCLPQVLFPLNIDFKIINENQVALFPMNTVQVSGFIVDSLSREPLIGAHIYNPTTNQGAITDDNGFFRLSARSIDSIYRISYIGYRDLTINTNQVLPSQFLLRSQDLSPILVFGKNLDYVSKYTLQQDELQLLNANLFEQLPSLGAEPDVLQYAAQSSGVYLGTDGVSGLRVRGGSTDQNLISVDEIPVYYPFHIIGYKSIFSSSAVSQLAFNRSGFDVGQQGRLSSYLNISSRDPSLTRLKASGSLGTLFGIGNLEFPIKKDQTAMGLKVKSSLFGPLIEQITEQYYADQDIFGNKYFDFHDLQAKVVHHSKNRKSLLKLFFIRSHDSFLDNIDYTFEDTEEFILDHFNGRYQYKNNAGYFQWIHYFPDSWQTSTKLYYSNYWYRSLTDNDYAYRLRAFPEDSFDWRYNLNFQSQLDEIGIKHRWDYRKDLWSMSFGTDIMRYRYQNRMSSYYQEDLRLPSAGGPLESYGKLLENFAWNGYLYFQLKRSIGQWDIQMNTAFNQYHNDSFRQWHWIPRFSIQRMIRNQHLLFLQVDRNIQNQHLLSLSYSGLPNEIWVPANEFVPAQTSSEISLGLKSRWSQFYCSSAVYYKWLDGIIDLSDQAISLNESVLDQISFEFWDEYVDFGSSENIGLEINTQFQSAKIYAQINYTLSSAIRQFDSKYYNLLLDYEYNPLHQISIQSILSPHKKWSFGLSWIFTSSNSIPLTEGSYDVISGNYFLEQIDIPAGELEVYYLPTFHRLNLSVNFSSTGQHLKHEAKVALSNVYNLTNYTHFKIFNQASAAEDFATLRLFESLPFIPSFYYRIIF